MGGTVREIKLTSGETVDMKAFAGRASSILLAEAFKIESARSGASKMIGPSAPYHIELAVGWAQRPGSRGSGHVWRQEARVVGFVCRLEELRHAGVLLVLLGQHEIVRNPELLERFEPELKIHVRGAELQSKVAAIGASSIARQQRLRSLEEVFR